MRKKTSTVLQNKLKQDIATILDGEVEDNAESLGACSRDASLFEVRPRLVVFPKHAGDVRALVRYIARKKRTDPTLSLTARSAGTDMTGGPLTESIVVEFLRHMTHVKSIGKDQAVTEPGVFYRDFDRETKKRHLFLPSYPASRELCTVGGMVANNSGGEKTLRYGKTDRYVQELHVVLRDGREHVFRPLTIAELRRQERARTLTGKILCQLHALVRRHHHVLQSARPRVSKNSAGYALWDVLDEEAGTFDPTKVFVGSQGTLGLITEITFSLVRPKPYASLLVIFLQSMELLAEVVERVLRYEPESFESYDDQTFKVAVKCLPDLARRMKGSLLPLAFSFLPEFFAVLTGGVPKLVLLAEFTGETPQEAAEHARRARESLAPYRLKTRIAGTERKMRKYWIVRRESFNLLRQKVRGLHTAPFIDDFVVDPRMLPVFLPKLYRILDRYKTLYTVAGHVGDGNFHIIPLMDFADPKTKDIVTRLSREVYALVLKFDGTITGEHNDGLVRSPYLREQFGKTTYRLFQETKRIFDPHNIFNPGKKVGASWAYALQHFLKDAQ